MRSVLGGKIKYKATCRNYEHIKYYDFTGVVHEGVELTDPRTGYAARIIPGTTFRLVARKTGREYRIVDGGAEYANVGRFPTNAASWR